jgi:phage baseplate assembly protein W
MVEREDSVRQALLLLLTTVPGERVMRPDYGCELNLLIFSPNDDTTAGLAIYYVRRAIDRWEPRITVERLDAMRDPEDGWRLNIVLEYRVKATQQLQSLIFPIVLTGEAV